MQAKVISAFSMGGGRDLYPGTDDAPTVVDLSDEEFARFKRLGYVVAYVAPVSDVRTEEIETREPAVTTRDPRKSKK